MTLSSNRGRFTMLLYWYVMLYYYYDRDAAAVAISLWVNLFDHKAQVIGVRYISLFHYEAARKS